MFDWLFSSDLPLAVRFAIAFVIVLALVMGGAALMHRLRNRGPRGASGGRGRQARLGVLDVLAIDSRRSLVIVRRDNVEHLIMIGGPNDVVVESAIVRNPGPPREVAPAVELGVRPENRAAAAVPAGRGAAAQPMPGRAMRQEPTLSGGRPAPAPQPIPASQPAAAPAPAPAQAAAPPLPAAPVQPAAEPQPAPEVAPQQRPQQRPQHRPVAASPQVPAPAPAPQPQQPAPAAESKPVEPPRLQAGPRPVPREPQPVRAAPPSEPPPAPPQPGSVLRPLRPALSPARSEPAPQPVASEQSVSPQHADPLFSDIAARLEEALTPKPRPPAPPAAAKPPAPPAPAAAPAEAPEPRPRSAFDSLEEEMASLLGRDPKRPG